MKKLIVLFLTICMGAALLTGCGAKDSGSQVSQATKGNFTDEMKIPYTCDLSPEDGADRAERLGDHQDSPTTTIWTSTTWSPPTP